MHNHCTMECRDLSYMGVFMYTECCFDCLRFDCGSSLLEDDLKQLCKYMDTTCIYILLFGNINLGTVKYILFI